VGMKAGPTNMETCMEVSQNTKNRTCMWSSYTASGYIPKRIKISCLRVACMTCLSWHYSQQCYRTRLGNHNRWMGKEKLQRDYRNCIELRILLTEIS
jgi:hypothetical protein